MKKFVVALTIISLTLSCSKDDDSKSLNNTAPSIKDQEFIVSETLVEKAIIGTLKAADPDVDQLTFEITKNDNDLFMLTEKGQLSLAEGKTVNIEAATTYNISVSVSDGVETASATVKITVVESIAKSPDSFLTVWNAKEIKLDLEDEYEYNYTIDWGDGTIEELTKADGSPEHTYTNLGTYIVAIKGEFPALNIPYGYNSRIIGLEQWGGIQWEDLSEAFYLCNNMIYNAKDAPNLSQVSSLRAMFYGATSFNGDLSNWDVSTITDMRIMFYEATSFNGDISTWNVSNVTKMTSMFEGATSFNGDISDWDVSNVFRMSIMFAGAISFNADISEWDVSKVSAITGMFSGATSFNRDLGNWNISVGINMGNMLSNSGMSKANLGSTLIGWNNYVEQNNGPKEVSLGIDNLSICLDSEAYSALLNLQDNHMWEFTGQYSLEQCN